MLVCQIYLSQWKYGKVIFFLNFYKYTNTILYVSAIFRIGNRTSRINIYKGKQFNNLSQKITIVNALKYETLLA